MRGSWAFVLLVAACGHAAPPPKAVEQPLGGVADLVGTWVASDDLDWGYKMTIQPKGGIAVVIDRARMGRCEQKGTLAPGSSDHVFVVTYKHGDCNKAIVNHPFDLTVASFSGASLTIVVGDQRWVYQRVAQ
jgi:hypothetical protein